MFAVDNADELGELVWEAVFEVVVLVDVCREVVEERRSLADDELPVALPDADDLCRAVAHLPIEEVVPALLLGLAEQGGTEGDAVKRPSPALP